MRARMVVQAWCDPATRGSYHPSVTEMRAAPLLISESPTNNRLGYLNAPPSMPMILPLTHSAASEARKHTARATSSGSPTR